MGILYIMARHPARAVRKCKPKGADDRVRNGEPSVQISPTIARDRVA